MTSSATRSRIPAKPRVERPGRSPGGIRRRRIADKVSEFVLFCAAAFSIVITVGVVGILVYESLGFFEHVSLWDFFTDTQWAPLFDEPRYGIAPLIAGTVTVTAVALLVSIPVGTICAIWLSEYAPPRLR